MERILRIGVATCRRGLTIVELISSTAIISTLMALLLPAVQASREVSRNLRCQNNLHQVGVALMEHHDLHGGLPPGWTVDMSEESASGWAPAILIGLEELSLANEVGRTPNPGTVSPLVSATTPRTLICPSDVAAASFELFAEVGDHETHGQDSQEVLAVLPAANYLGVFGTTDPDHVPGTTGDGVFIQDRSCRIADMSRGTSHVLLVGERTARKLPSTWLGIMLAGEDAAGRVTGYCESGPNRPDADECEFDSRHPGHANFLWGDGRAAPVAELIDRQVYQTLARRQ